MSRAHRTAPSHHFSGGQSIGKLVPLEYGRPDMSVWKWVAMPLLLIGLGVLSLEDGRMPPAASPRWSAEPEPEVSALTGDHRLSQGEQ